MKNQFSLKRATVGILTVIMITSISMYAYSYGNGVSGRTLKPGSTNGCTCHSNGQNTAVTPSVTGPTTLTAGTTGTYSFTVTRSSGSVTKAGIDIAVSSGTLGIGSSTGIKLSSGEVVHSSAFTTTTTKSFTLTAPSTPGTVTIYVTGAAGGSQPAWNNGTSFNVTITSTTGINQISETATTYSLAQNFPNPFNPTTNINFSVPKSQFVNVSIYDITGKLVQELVNSNLAAGKYNTTWDAANFSSGVYFYKIQAGDFIEMKKMSLIK
jgi:hypothetical protein